LVISPFYNYLNVKLKERVSIKFERVWETIISHIEGSYVDQRSYVDQTLHHLVIYSMKTIVGFFQRLLVFFQSSLLFWFQTDAHSNYFQWVDEVKHQIEQILHTKGSISILQVNGWSKV